MSRYSREKARATFVVPATAGDYAPERITFGLPGVEPTTREEELQGITVALESGPANAVVELWLAKVGTRPDAAGAPEDGDYFYAGKALTSGYMTSSLAGYVGAQIRVKSGGTAGNAVVNATANGGAVASDGGSGVTAGGSTVASVGGAYASAEVTRPADTDAYLAGDVLANSTTTGSVTFLEFDLAAAPGGLVRIDHAHAETDQAANTAQLRVHLFAVARASLATATPVDNAANLFRYDNRANYLGFIDLLPFGAGTGSNTSARTKPVQPALLVKCAAGATKIFAQLETRTAFTPASAQKVTLVLGATQY